MRISVVVLASLAASVSAVGAQSFERPTPLPTSSVLFTSISDRAFSTLVARETQSLFRFDFLSATLEHTLGERGTLLAVPLASPASSPTAPMPEGAGRSEPAAVVTSPVAESAATPATPPIEQARESHEPVRAEPPRNVERPEKPVTPGEPVVHEPDASPPVTSTPEPATIALTASGLAALFGYAKRRRKSNRDE